MNIQQLRQSLKLKWVNHYYKNRSWLVKLQVWGTYDGQRRPSSGFILAAMSVLEPQLNEIFPFILDLNNNPDQIVAALGLNFNPEEQLHLIESDRHEVASQGSSESPPETLCVGAARHRHRQPDTSIAVASKPENKPQPATSIAVASKPENKPQPVTSIAVASKFHGKHRKSQPVASTAVASKLDTQSQPKALVSVTSKLDSKNQHVKTQQKNVPNKVHLSPIRNPSSLPNWIDDFCQGME
jgi:hypothetical protein